MAIHSSIHRSAQRSRFLATTCALLASALLLACGSSSASPHAIDDDGRHTEVADSGARGATSAFDSGLGSDVDVSPWEEVAPTLAHVSGGDVEVVEGGAGGATVVFESGLSNDWTSWDEVAGAVAERAHVFAYSRPGYGGSDPTTAPRNATRIVEDLRVLLAARGLEPPYVLVGHSFGGTYMELFAKAYPQEVVGVVLVDSRHRDFTDACDAADLDGCTIPHSILASLSQVERAEYEAFASTSEAIRAAEGFGPYPVRVLTATSHGFDPAVENLWVSMHRSLANEAVQGEQIVFPGAGHLLQLERPHEVAEVILNLIPASESETDGM